MILVVPRPKLVSLKSTYTILQVQVSPCDNVPLRPGGLGTPGADILRYTGALGGVKSRYRLPLREASLEGHLLFFFLYQLKKSSGLVCSPS